jgi:Ca2+-binding RTX toxin-like protein
MTPTDPLYASQWHFPLLGDIETIWEEFDGTGVTVGVYDDGVDFDHEDLDDNFDSSLRVVDDLGNPVDGFPDNFIPGGDAHGTACAGLIAGEANGVGGIGVAHGSTIGSVNIFGPSTYGFVNGNTAAFMDVAGQATMFDISSNSWGATPYYRQGLHDGGFAEQLDEVYAEVAATGRGGLGTVITQAAGNDDMDANGDGINVSRFTITVAATDELGAATWYTNYGASIFVAAPAGAVTTDLSGTAGYDESDYTTDFGGTSAATPITSGVIALMLDANDGLGWRDVQNILAASATLTGGAFNQTAPVGEEDSVWQSNSGTTWNGGGYHVHGNYGYGMVNVFNAVRMAEVWSLFGDAQTSANEVSVSGSNDFADVTVPNTPGAGVTRTINISGNVEIEHVALTLAVDSDQMWDLEVRLTSAQGTTITVAYDQSGFNPFDSVDGLWTYGIDHLRGELAQGEWTVEVIDNRAPSRSTVLESASLTIYGQTVSANDVHHITDEYREMRGFESGRGTVRDNNGGHDWLNLAATTDDMRVDLQALTFGTLTTVWGNLSGSFEHIVTGDGDDTVIGNSANGQMFGMRGNDLLRGEVGNDYMEGGTGNDRLFGGTGNDYLEGNAGNDILNGDDGHDTLSGSDGVDSLRGGLGNDLYFYAAGASIVERSGGGSDRVLSDVTYGLTVNTENLTLEGSGNIGGSGNGLANTIWGNSGDNSLNGAAGNDTLLGGAGNDLLLGGNDNDRLDGGSGNDLMTGGQGRDVFVFSTGLAATNVDTITDFVSGVDRIHLDDAIFAGLAAGTLSAGAFAANASGTAVDASDRILFNTVTGEVFLDTDGTGGAAAVRFAVLSPAAAIAAADFFVF